MSADCTPPPVDHMATFTSEASGHRPVCNCGWTGGLVASRGLAGERAFEHQAEANRRARGEITGADRFAA